MLVSSFALVIIRVLFPSDVIVTYILFLLNFFGFFTNDDYQFICRGVLLSNFHFLNCQNFFQPVHLENKELA